MNRFLGKIFIGLFLFSVTACYGSWNIFYDGNNVDYRTRSLQDLKDTEVSALSGKYRVLVLTDTHFGSNRKNPPVEKLYDWLDSVKGTEKAPVFALSLGDSTDTGSQSEFDEYLKFCNHLQSQYGIKMIFNSCGNHDIYQSHWDNWKNNCYPHTSFYKFKTAGLTWYCLDTASGTLGKQQYEIFKREVESDSNSKIVFSHYPLTEYNLAFGLGETTERNLLISSLLKNKVLCYFGGHNHYYHYLDMGLKDYCCPSFCYNEKWVVLCVDEEKGTTSVELIKN